MDNIGNKHQNCVRISHRDSGVTATGQSSRGRKANTVEAFRGLTTHPKFKMWLSQRMDEVIRGKTLEEEVKEMMRPENLKIEVCDDGKWLEI